MRHKLLELTAVKARSMFENSELSSHQLVSYYLDRVARIDQAGPRLNSVLEINPDALIIADAMDRERGSGRVRSPLHGMPILIKDNINTADKLRTSAGSLALADNFAPYDASIISRIRDAGLVILGKTNMTEFANYMSSRMKNGYSSRGGQVLHAYNEGGEVWGSSTGSAVALAANLCLFSIGTETNGSILGPSNKNSTVGIKPTQGLVSRHGIIPICTAQDTAGPMARTVSDCAALMNVIVGEDFNDPATWGHSRNIPADYTDFLQKDGLQELRIGVNRAYYDQLTGQEIDLIEQACEVLADQGAFLVQDTNLDKFRCDEPILLYEFQKCLNYYLSTVNTKCRSLADIIKFYMDHPVEGLKYGMDILLDAQLKASGNCHDPQYLSGRLEAIQVSRQEGLDRVFEENSLDLLACPGSADFAPVSGYPGINLPVGYDAGNNPFGLTFVGRPYAEPVLIKAAYAYEQASQMRKLPPLEETS